MQLIQRQHLIIPRLHPNVKLQSQIDEHQSNCQTITDNCQLVIQARGSRIKIIKKLPQRTKAMISLIYCDNAVILTNYIPSDVMSISIIELAIQTIINRRRNYGREVVHHQISSGLKRNKTADNNAGPFELNSLKFCSDIYSVSRC